MNIISFEGNYIAHRSYPLTSISIMKSMQFTNAIAHPTVMYRKEVIDLCGGYKRYLFCEDLDLWLRLMNAGILFSNLPEVLVYYRQDTTGRDKHNWRCNLQVRISNFSSQYLILRIIGIFCIAVWIIIPEKFKEKIYNLLLLKYS
jgi:GT2 family glycosyltransferase